MSAYEPRELAIMMTALTLNIPMGSRATRLPRVKARVPGSAKRRRYGVNGDMTEQSPGTPGTVQHLLLRD